MKDRKEVRRKHVSLGETSTDIVLGRTDYSNWTDEELLRGQRKSRRGRWEGKPPTVVPMELIHEQNRRRCTEAIVQLQDTVRDATKYVRQCIRGEVEPNATRLQASIHVLNRVLGPERIQVEISSPSPFELAGVTRAIVIRKALGPGGQEAIDADSKETSEEVHPEFDPDYESGYDPFESDERVRPSPRQDPVVPYTRNAIKDGVPTYDRPAARPRPQSKRRRRTLTDETNEPGHR